MSSTLHPALKISYKEKMERAAQKRQKLVQFLASGEVFSTTALAAELLEISEQTVLPMLQRLVADKILRVDEKAIPFSKTKLWGITSHGISLCPSAHPKCNEFRVGKTKSNFLDHHLDCQFVRICMERRGWTNWVPDKMLRTENSKRLNKIPDFLATRSDGTLIAGEIERNIKAQTRMAEMIAGHVQQIIEGHYDLVYYYTEHIEALKRVFQKVDRIKIGGVFVNVTEKYRRLFIFEDIRSSAMHNHTDAGVEYDENGSAIFNPDIWMG